MNRQHPDEFQGEDRQTQGELDEGNVLITSPQQTTTGLDVSAPFRNAFSPFALRARDITLFHSEEPMGSDCLRPGRTFNQHWSKTAHNGLFWTSLIEFSKEIPTK
jgi:hypothetical protein